MPQLRPQAIEYRRLEKGRTRRELASLAHHPVDALRTDRGLALAAGFAALLAAVVAAATLVTKTPLSGIETLLIPAFPMLMVGQLRTIGILNARLPQPAGGWWARWTAQVRAQQNPRTFLSAGFRPWPPMP